MANKEISFAFEYDDGRIVHLPITPEDIEISYPGSNKAVNIIQLGQVNLLKKRNLATFTIESWFPDESWYPGVRTSGRFEDSSFYVSFFEKIRDDRKPCWFYIFGLNFNMQVSIESFTHERRGGEHEDLYYTLQLKEYRPFAVQEVPVTEDMTFLSKKTPILEPTEITIGSTVIVNGTLHRDSYGSNPGKTLNNFTGRVSLINKSGSHPYHIIDTSGGWLGWVNREAIGLSPSQITGMPIMSRPKSTSASAKKSSKGVEAKKSADGTVTIKNMFGEVIETVDVANWKGAEKTKAMHEMLKVDLYTTKQKMMKENIKKAPMYIGD